MPKSLSSLLISCLFALLTCPAHGQGPTPLRKQAEEPGLQDQINDAFGHLVELAAYVPFLNIGEWLGIDSAPHRRVDDADRTVLDSFRFDGLPGGIELAQFTRSGRRILAADKQHQVAVLSLFRQKWRHSEEERKAAGIEGADPARVPSPILAYLTGHTDKVTSLAMFPDGAGSVAMTDDFYRKAEFLTGSRDGTARIWRLCSAEEESTEGLTAPATVVEREARQTLEHGAPVSVAVYSASGRWIATGAEDGTVKLWDAACKMAHRMQGFRGGVKAMSFFGDDLLQVTPGEGPAVWYSAETGKVAEAPSGSNDPTAKAGYIASGISAAGLQLQDGTTLPIPGIVEGALAADRTRALSFDEAGVIQVHEWLVRGPTDKLATTEMPLVVLWLVIAAVLFTLFFRFVNFRMFKHAILCVAGKYSDPKDQGEVSHFQALSTALSATVGLGNIAGVAIAVMIGGPGATLWMIVAGLLGMTLKFTECTLGQKFRVIGSDGSVSGGPMHYLADGLKAKGLGGLGALLAFVFSIFCIGGSVAGGNAFQVNQSLGVLRGQVPFFDHNPWVYGLLMAFFVGVVIIGGIRSIARVAEKIVPTMCSIYVLASLVLIFMHLGDVPAAVGRIFSSALSGDAVYGGAIGALVMGFRRAAFSNEAGVGSASIAHSAAKTPYAVREGIVALLEPFIDTVVVCSITALVIGITGVYNAPEHAEIIESTNGAALTAAAFGSVEAFRSWFPWLLMVAVALFAYSTMISWSYYGERCAVNLFGPKASLPFKLVFLLFTVLGSVVTATNVLEFGDLMILLMAFPNILGLYFLSGIVKKDLQVYEQKLDSGEIQKFH